MRFRCTPAPYRLALAPLNDDPVAYSLRIRHFDICRLDKLSDHGDTPWCASPLEVGGATAGVLGDRMGGDSDYFTFSLEEQMTVVADIAGTMVESTAAVDSIGAVIYDSHGQRLAMEQSNLSLPAVRLVKDAWSRTLLSRSLR